MKYFFLFTLILLLGCSKQDSQVNEYFKATIINGSESDFDLYLGTVDRLNDFEFISTIKISQSIIIDSLQFSTSYVCRITCVDEHISEYYYELPFKIENGNAEITIQQSKIE